MVKCPNCGEEYSLGRKIYHECNGFCIFHGVICHEKCIDHPWNCNSEKERNNLQQLEINDYLTNNVKHINMYK